MDPDGKPIACIDDNECDRPDSCGNSTVCSNRDGGYYCSCQEGYYDAAHETEQAAWNRIDDGTFAEGVNSSYVPRNSSGEPVIGDVTQCTNGNECDASRFDCDMNLLNVCVDTDGSYVCECAVGTRYVNVNVSNECTDIDECDEYTFVCDPNAACVNDILDLFKLMAGKTVCI